MTLNGSTLQDICGLHVKNIRVESDDLGLLFENGANLIVYNKFNFHELPLSQISKLLGACVSLIKEDQSFICICFDNDIELVIDMRDDAYRSPEAMQLRFPGKPISIWN